jgi:cytochrome c-type biogenesis protein CcmE
MILQPKLLAVGAVLALAVGYLVLTGLQTTTVYYLTVSELQGRGPSAQPVRVAGTVAPGSIVKDADGLGLRFAVQDATGQIPVVYDGGTTPDIFAEHVEVVAEGKYGPDGTFHATTLLAKCPSKFEGAVAAKG